MSAEEAERPRSLTPLRELSAFQHDGLRGCVDGVTPNRAMQIQLEYGTLYAYAGYDETVHVIVTGTGGGLVRADESNRNELLRQLKAQDVGGSTEGRFGKPAEIVPSRFYGGDG